MTFAEELQRYLERGIDLQHRRLEGYRAFENGEVYKHYWEESVKWRQDIPAKLKAPDAVVPATWGIVPSEF